jgi:hypothetical protein
MATYDETNSSTMACIANLATSLTKQGKYTEAESQLQRLRTSSVFSDTSTLARAKRVFIFLA